MRIAVLTPPRNAGRSIAFAEAVEVSACIDRLGHESLPAIFQANRGKTEKLLDKIAPDVVFNLVDDVTGGPAMLHLVTQSLERLRLRYTGVQNQALEAVCDKPRMRATLVEGGLPVAPDLMHGEEATRYTVKQAVAHQSPDAPAPGVVTGRHAAETMVVERTRAFGGRWFAEAFIDGREFNLFVVETMKGPLALPATEVVFSGKLDDRPSIVGYDETWSSGEEPEHARATFPETDKALVAELDLLAVSAWRLFAMTGYARIDFRVDEAGRPYIFEINPNPSLVSGAGFCAAAGRAGMSQTDAVAHILAAATN